MNVYQLIDKIRENPKKYIGNNGLAHFHTFLGGYFMDRDDEYYNHDEINFDFFHDYVAIKFGYGAVNGWSRIIGFKAKDKEDALNLFFELLDDFRTNINHEISRIAYDKEFTHKTGTISYIVGEYHKEFAISKLKLNPNKDLYLLIGYYCESHWRSSHDCFDDLETLYKEAFERYGIKKEEWEV